ncbi:hypothetical protein ACOSQ3_028127 [Xanthoceras sorbifolium]
MLINTLIGSRHICDCQRVSSFDNEYLFIFREVEGLCVFCLQMKTQHMSTSCCLAACSGAVQISKKRKKKKIE